MKISTDMNWHEPSGWEYHIYSRNTVPPDLAHAEKFIRLWQSKSEGGNAQIPSWKNFDFLDFRGLHGRIVLQRVEREPFDIRYTLWGTKAAQIYGQDLTGKALSELEGDRSRVELEYLHRLVEVGGFGMIKGPIYWEGRMHRTISFVDLPLSDDGVNVDGIVSLFTDEGVSEKPRDLENIGLTRPV